jgi:hypothetical protein
MSLSSADICGIPSLLTALLRLAPRVASMGARAYCDVGIRNAVEPYSDRGVCKVNPVPYVPWADLIDALQRLQPSRKATHAKNAAGDGKGDEGFKYVCHRNDNRRRSASALTSGLSPDGIGTTATIGVAPPG